MSDVFWHSEPGVDFFGPKWRQTIWKLKIRQLRWAALKHSGCWVVLKLLHSLIFFYLRHRSASDDKIQHVYTGVFSSGSRRHLPPEVGVRFSVIFSGHPGHPGHPRRSDRSCDACFAPTIQPRQVRSLGKECRFRRKKMNPAPGLKIEILQDSSFWKTAIDRHSLWGCRLQHRYNPVARLG